jgi:hypothetical protein
VKWTIIAGIVGRRSSSACATSATRATPASS